MRVTYILNSMNIGGGNRSMEMLWKELLNYNVKPYVVSPGKGPFQQLIENAGISNHFTIGSLQYDFGINARSVYLILQYFIHLMRDRIEIVHANSMQMARYIAIPSRIMRIPLIVHIRYYQNQDYIKWVYKYVPKPHAFIFNSHNMKKELGSYLKKYYGKTKQYVIHNGIDTEKFCPEKKSGDKKTKIGIIGNFQKIKGHEDFLIMAKVLLQDSDNMIFSIAGTDIEKHGREKELKKMANELSIKRNVIFEGYIENISEYIKSLDILVSTSHSEPFGRTLIEGMACGIPVVSTNVGGIPEIVQNEKTGILVPPKSPKIMADAICALVANKEKLIEMGVRGRKRVMAKFSNKNHVKKVFEVYKNALSKS